jgi:hypothetical protein
MPENYEKWKRKQRFYMFLFVVGNIAVFVLSFLWGCRIVEAIAHIAK